MDDVVGELPNVSHMLKGTLTVMMGYAEMLADPSNGEISASKLMFADRILSAGRIMRLQLGNLSMYGHLQGEGVKLHRERLEMSTEIDHVAHEWDGAWGVSLQYTAPPNLMVSADRRSLQMVLENLVSNAMRHSPSGASARLTARAAHGRVTVTVTNSGLPIPPEHVNLLFRPFGRLPGHRGTGLGLYVVKSLLEAHGSGPLLKSDATRGTRLSFSLPLEGSTVGDG